MRLRHPIIVIIALAGIILLASTVATVVGAQSQSGQVVGKPDITIQTTTIEFDQRTTGQLQLSITNRGRIDRGGPAQYEDRVTTARGLTLSAESGDTPIQVNTGQVAVGNVPTGTAPVDPIRITIPENATPGTYTLPIEYEYAYTRIVEYNVYGADYTDRTWSQTDSITIRVRDHSRFEVVNIESTTQIGDTGELNVTMKNTGTDPAREASVTATAGTTELRFANQSQTATAFVGNWPAGEPRTVSYDVGVAADARLREYLVNLAVSYTDTDGMDRDSRTLKAGVTPAPEQHFSIVNASSTLRVGEENTLTGTVVNDGPEPVYNPVITVSATNQQINIQTPEYALPDLAPGDSAPFAFTVDISQAADANVQQFTFTIDYRNDEGNTRVSDKLQTANHIEPERDRFVVAFHNDSGTIEAGTQHPAQIRVTNNGDVPLTTIEAKAFVTDPLDSNDDEAIIPELAPGESTTITIDLSASSSALSKSYPISLDFQYDMPNGDTELSRTYTLPVTVTIEETQSAVSLELVIGAGGIIGIVGLIVWYRRTR